MTPRALWLLFVLLTVGAIAAPTLARSQATALCNDGFCVVLESQLRDLQQHLINLQKLLDDRRCS
jgi:hypothetical protein